MDDFGTPNTLLTCMLCLLVSSMNLMRKYFFFFQFHKFADNAATAPTTLSDGKLAPKPGTGEAAILF